ncbi:MAG: hypothetical protein ABSA71_15360 [Desulfomonilia bacterium]
MRRIYRIIAVLKHAGGNFTAAHHGGGLVKGPEGFHACARVIAPGCVVYLESAGF